MKLFEINPYLRTFTADVVEQTILEDRPAVVLSQTAFYPLGGGQEADRGKLNGIEVIDVIERQNKIYHILADDITESTVEGEIDWQRRYDHMQQHTGEHILSGLVLQRFGLNNVGFHIGQQLMRVDYDGFLDWPELLELERETNRVIGQNLTVVDDIYQEGDDEYRFKKELTGTIRIVDVPGIDRCACCGTHVKSTAEVGLLKIVEAEKYKGGVRLGIVCGERALDYFQKLVVQTKDLMQVTNAQTFGLVPAVKNKYSELLEKDKQLAEMERRLVDLMAQSFSGQSEPIVVFEQLGNKATSNLANLLAEKAPFVAIFHSQGNDSFRFYLHSKNQDMATLAKQLMKAFPGKGGGRGQTAQGTLKAGQTEILEWMRKLK